MSLRSTPTPPPPLWDYVTAKSWRNHLRPLLHLTRSLMTTLLSWMLTGGIGGGIFYFSLRPLTNSRLLGSSRWLLARHFYSPHCAQIQSHSYSYPGPVVGADNPFSRDTLCFHGLDKILLLGFFHHRNPSSASFVSTFLVKSLNVGLYQDLSLCRTASHQMTAFRLMILNSIYMPNDNAYVAHFWSLPWNYR